MVGLDTSVVVRLLIGEPELQAAAALRFLQRSVEPVLVSDLVIAESYFALRHHYATPHAAAIEFLIRLAEHPRIRTTTRAREVLAVSAHKEAPGLVDRLIHADYQEQGATLLTFDRSAARLERARLLR